MVGRTEGVHKLGTRSKQRFAYAIRAGRSIREMETSLRLLERNILRMVPKDEWSGMSAQERSVPRVAISVLEEKKEPLVAPIAIYRNQK